MAYLRVIIEQDNETIAVLDNWDGPLPRKDDYIFHPPLNGGPEPAEGGHMPGRGVMQVKLVTWGILARPAGNGPWFTGRSGTTTDRQKRPYVVITV